MPAFLEPLGHGVFILRAGPQAVQYGDPYTASGVVVTAAPGVAEVKGFTRRIDDLSAAVAILRDARTCLRGAGFFQFQWERKRPTGPHLVTTKT